MAVKNLEKNVFDRIITQIKGIDGTGNYNFNIPDRDIHEDFVFHDGADVKPGKPVICVGSVQSEGRAVRRGRVRYEIPFLMQIIGYTREKSSSSAEDQNLKLVSDLRLAIGSDTHLNEQVTELDFDFDTGAIEGDGEVVMTIAGNILYDTTE